MVSHDEIKKMLENKRNDNKNVQNENKESDNDPIETSEKKDYGFLFCKRCNGYYKLQEGENIDDFESCECGEKLVYVDKIEEI